ncbi:glycerol-3-phosphate 1-O-acyltransferase PlsY [Kaarinaea lacus]
MPVLDSTFYFLVAIAYLMGSLSTAIIVCKLMGLPDPRTQGSQNPGATNVLRIGGKQAAAITLAGDALKGLLPVLLGYAVHQPIANLGILGFAAFIGHLYPIFFSFRGGKGVATAFGAIIGISWTVGLAVLATWLAMAKIFKISSLAALTAAFLAPLYFWLFESNLPLLFTSILMSVMLIYRHRSNIRNLVKGTEDTIH